MLQNNCMVNALNSRPVQTGFTPSTSARREKDVQPQDQVSLGAQVSPEQQMRQAAQRQGRAGSGGFGGEGYDPNFLGLELPMPKLMDSIKDQAAPLLADPSSSELKYTHFSVIQNKERRTPMLTAANVDGAQYNEQPRDGKWDFDRRIDTRYQTGNDAYSNNAFDRGHMVRRRDPMWGSNEVALKGSRDTFAFTNAALQHSSLNQHNWLDLENHILSLANHFDRKVTVFTGPVLKDSDPSFDNKGKMSTPTKIPMEFYKVMVWNEPGEGLKGEAFVMSQENFVKNRAGAPDRDDRLQDFTPFRVPLEKLEQMVQIDFGDIKDNPVTSAPVPMPPGGGD